MDVHFFHNLLKPSAILSQFFQDDELCVTEAIEAILKANKNIENLKTNFDNLLTVKKVISTIQDTDDINLPRGTDNSL